MICGESNTNVTSQRAEVFVCLPGQKSQIFESFSSPLRWPAAALSSVAALVQAADSGSRISANITALR